MNAMLKHNKLIFIIASIVLLTFAACGGNINTETSQATEPDVVQSGGEQGLTGESQQDEPTGNEQTIQSESPQAETPVSTTEVESYALGFNLGGPDLRATDPSTVSLANGEIQLVEFFAFW